MGGRGGRDGTSVLRHEEPAVTSAQLDLLTEYVMLLTMQAIQAPGAPPTDRERELYTQLTKPSKPSIRDRLVDVLRRFGFPCADPFRP